MTRTPPKPNSGMVAQPDPRPRRGPGTRGGTSAVRPSWTGFVSCRRGVATLEFVLMAGPFLLMLFGFVATNAVFYTWSTMQSNAQYAARLMSTGQINNLTTGPISTANSASSTACSGALTPTQVESYACTGLPLWMSFTVTVTEDCTVPSVTVGLSVSASKAAIADVFSIFGGQTLATQAVLMKEGTCP